MEWIDIFQHHFYMIFYGIIFWYVLMWGIAKSKAERKNKPFHFGIWRKEQMDDILIAVFTGFAFLAWDDEVLLMWQEYSPENAPSEFQSWMYFLVGPVADGLYKLVTKIKSNGN